ncbi:uncharacterized protein LOC144124330 [Amblyomma americanum]
MNLNVYVPSLGGPLRLPDAGWSSVHAGSEPSLMRRCSADAAVHLPVPVLALGLPLALLIHLALLVTERGLAEAVATFERQESILVRQICRGTQAFTTTINLLLTFGRRTLERPFPLGVGENFGLNLTLRGLDTLSLRTTPDTFCNESVAQAWLPLRLSPSVVASFRSPLVPSVGKDITGTLRGLELNVVVQVHRNDPSRRVVISSLRILNLDGIDVEVTSFVPISGTPLATFFQLPAMPWKVALLQRIIRAALQRFLDSGALPF